MRIAICGAQGTGKTTLARDFVAASKKTDHPFTMIDEAARKALVAGFKLDRDATLETQLWILTKQLELEMNTPESWVADRGLIDAYIYPKALDFPAEELEFLERLVLRNLSYDHMLLVPAGEFAIEGDGVRAVDYDLQKKLDAMYRAFLKEHSILYTEINGTTTERVAKLQNLIAR